MKDSFFTSSLLTYNCITFILLSFIFSAFLIMSMNVFILYFFKVERDDNKVYTLTRISAKSSVFVLSKENEELYSFINTLLTTLEMFSVCFLYFSQYILAWRMLIWRRSSPLFGISRLKYLLISFPIESSVIAATVVYTFIVRLIMSSFVSNEILGERLMNK